MLVSLSDSFWECRGHSPLPGFGVSPKNSFSFFAAVGGELKKNEKGTDTLLKKKVSGREIMHVGNEEAIAEPCADRFHSCSQIGDAERAPQRRPQTYEPPILLAVHIPEAGKSERGWLLRSLPKGQQYTLDCEPSDRVPG